MKALHLTLKSKWYDLIEAGIKKEEYRDITEYWIVRLCDEFGFDFSETIIKPKDFTHVHFARGGHFHPSIPQMRWELKEIVVGNGKPEWGAEPDKKYFVIKLGDRVPYTDKNLHAVASGS